MKHSEKVTCQRIIDDGNRKIIEFLIPDTDNKWFKTYNFHLKISETEEIFNYFKVNEYYYINFEKINNEN